MNTKSNKRTSKTTKTTKTIGELAEVIQKKQTGKGKTEKTPRVKKPKPTYSGAPVQATRLYTKKLETFKNTEAHVLMAINDDAGTVTYLNTYCSGLLPQSYDASHYTYPLVEKKVNKKIKEMIEIEVTDWPSYVVQAGATTKKSRKRAMATA